MAASPLTIVSFPSVGNTFFSLDFAGYFHHFDQTFPVTLMFLFVSIFDTAGVQLMAGAQAGLIDDRGHLPGSKAAFFSAGFATCIGSLFGCCPVIIHTESCAGIADGARTGLHSVVVALLFLLSLLFVPLLGAVPSLVTAPALVIVGVYMMAAAKFVDWERIDEAVPAFLVATILPFTYSIANGVIAGLISFVILKAGAAIAGQLPKPAEADDHQLTPLLASHAMSSSRSLTPRGLKASEDPAPGSPIPYFLDHSQILNGHHPHYHDQHQSLPHHSQQRVKRGSQLQGQPQPSFYGTYDDNVEEEPAAHF